MTGTGAMSREIDVDHLNRMLEEGGTWTMGAVEAVLAAERIGADFGLSGTTYRFDVVADRGRCSLVAKFEAAAVLRKAVAFRRENERHLARLLPGSFGADLTGEEGVILLEHVAPAEQGDDLTGCSATQAFLVVDLVARLHAATRDAGPPRFEGWARREWRRGVFEDRLVRASRRYPNAIDGNVVDRLSRLESEATRAVDSLAGCGTSWIHMDPHLDNVLFRPDGTAVLLDWSGAVVGVPALDVAVLMMALCFRTNAPLDPDMVVERYRAVAQAPTALDCSDVASGLAVLLRGTVGGVGLPTEVAHRQAALRAEAAVRIRPALDWVDSVA